MRYDTPVYFQLVKQGEYDSSTGDYADEVVEEMKVYASVMDTTKETQRLIYGGLKIGSLTIHIQNHYNEPFDWIRVGDVLF